MKKSLTMSKCKVSITAQYFENYAALIGKKLYAYGWQYDNDGAISGTITHIQPAEWGDKVKVFVDSSTSWEFTPWEMHTLITKGEYDTQGWNWGSTAYIKE